MNKLHRSTWGLEVDRDTDWRSLAACGPDTADLFWINQGSGPTQLSKDNHRAVLICQCCPVREQCERSEREQRTRDPHIAAGLLWTIDGPRRVDPAAVRKGKAKAVA